MIRTSILLTLWVCRFEVNFFSFVDSFLESTPNSGTIPKGDPIKVVADARHLNSNTNQEFESWPIEPLASQLARANKKYKSTIDLMYAYAHTPIDEETIKLSGFSSGDNLYTFIREFYGIKGLPNFFTN